jgi:hypothetical protein
VVVIKVLHALFYTPLQNLFKQTWAYNATLQHNSTYKIQMNIVTAVVQLLEQYRDTNVVIVEVNLFKSRNLAAFLTELGAVREQDVLFYINNIQVEEVQDNKFAVFTVPDRDAKMEINVDSNTSIDQILVEILLTDQLKLVVISILLQDVAVVQIVNLFMMLIEHLLHHLLLLELFDLQRKTSIFQTTTVVSLHQQVDAE